MTDSVKREIRWLRKRLRIAVAAVDTLRGYFE
jgi:hypothetical protein